MLLCSEYQIRYFCKKDMFINGFLIVVEFSLLLQHRFIQFCEPVSGIRLLAYFTVWRTLSAL